MFTWIWVVLLYSWKIETLFLKLEDYAAFKEPFHRDGSFEYPQHTFWLRNKKVMLLLHNLNWSPAYVQNIIKTNIRDAWLELHLY